MVIYPCKQSDQGKRSQWMPYDLSVNLANEVLQLGRQNTYRESQLKSQRRRQSMLCAENIQDETIHTFENNVDA